jgi:hypothetical protein
VSYAVWVVRCVVQLTRGEEESECVGVSDVNGLLLSCLAWVFVVVVCTPALSWSGGGVFQGGGEVFAGGRGCIGHSTQWKSATPVWRRRCLGERPGAFVLFRLVAAALTPDNPKLTTVLQYT